MITDTSAISRVMTHHAQGDERTVLGFWIYVMTDCVLFACLFAVFVVLRGNTVGGPRIDQIVDLPYVMRETAALLCSSFTCGLGILAARDGRLRAVVTWFAVTFVLGATFLGLELSEFRGLAAAGEGLTRSGFLSGYFTLVGTHGVHIAVGLVWMLVLIPVIWRKGLTRGNLRRLTLLSIFWHFLDLVWIFIFTVVYLMGAARA